MAADSSDGRPGDGSAGDSASAPARLVHRTRERARLRVPERRRDLQYFLALYEDLRARPGIDEVSMNPVTGSVLLGFGPGTDLDALLADNPLLTLVAEPAGDDHPHSFHMGLNNMRILIFVIMTGLSIQQLLKGQILVPILTMALYVIDLAVNLQLEHEAAVKPHPHDGDAAGTA